MIESIFDEAQRRITGAFEWVFDPLWRWYTIGFGIFLVCAVVAYFLPFKWVRAALGAVIVVTGAYIAGGRHMRNEMKAKLDEERAKLKQIEEQRRQQQPNWPFNW